MAVLVHLRADGQKRCFALSDRPARIGRDVDADIRLNEPLVSRTHATIEKRGQDWVLQDLDSRNFTRVNGERIRERRLSHGDELLFARTRCVFLVEDAPKSNRALVETNRSDSVSFVDGE
jgi:penicillin-binding protein 1A